MNTEPYFLSHVHRDLLVHICDGDLPTCEVLSVLFRVEGFRTSFSNSSAQFLAMLDRRRPEIAIINLQIGEESGILLLRRLKALRSAAIVVMLSDAPNVELAITAVKLGALDVLSKPVDGENLLDIVREAIRENHSGLLPRTERQGPSAPFALTPRETEVLQLIATGQANKEIARQLGISPRTVEVHRARIMQKLGARNTADLVRIALTG